MSDEIHHITITENEQLIEITAVNDRIPEKPPVPVIPNIPNIGNSESKGFLIGLGAIAIGGFVSAGVIYVKKKKDEDDE